MYHDLVEGWNVTNINESFDLVREIGNLFVVPYVPPSPLDGRLAEADPSSPSPNSPSALPDRMRDGMLARIKPQLLRAYLTKREDYGSAGIESIVCTLAMPPQSILAI